MLSASALPAIARIRAKDFADLEALDPLSAR